MQTSRIARNTGFRILALAIVLCLAGPVFAHDYWMLPDALRGAPGVALAVSLWVGEPLQPEEERGLQRNRTVRFVRLRAGRTDDLMAGAGDAGALLLGRLSMIEPGGHLLAMERNVARIELEPARFEAYLREEGLTAVLADRVRRGETMVRGRERYTRYLKALVQVGATHDEVFRRTVGHTLEILPQRDPASLHAGDRLPVTVVFRGRPLAGAALALASRGVTDVRDASATTDANGRAELPIEHDGVQLIHMVHMVRCDHCADADWESFWASFVFGVCPTAGAPCDGLIAAQRTHLSSAPH